MQVAPHMLCLPPSREHNPHGLRMLCAGGGTGGTTTRGRNGCTCYVRGPPVFGQARNLIFLLVRMLTAVCLDSRPTRGQLRYSDLNIEKVAFSPPRGQHGQVCGRLGPARARMRHNRAVWTPRLCNPHPAMISWLLKRVLRVKAGDGKGRVGWSQGCTCKRAAMISWLRGRVLRVKVRP